MRSVPFLTALAFLWLAMLLAGGARWAVDTSLLGVFYAGEGSSIALLATVVTQLGGWIALTLVTLAAAGWLVRGNEHKRALLLIALTLGGRLAVELQKYLSARTRPEEMEQLVAVHSLSFPSAHAANATITYVAIALLLFRSRTALATALALALLTGLTRLVLGVHWPSDVVGGWAFGLLWTLGLLRLAERGGTGPRLASLKRGKETIMSDDNKRPDDGELIHNMQDAPSQSGTSGGNLQRDIASQAEEEQLIGGKTGVTRVRKDDKADDGDVPTLPNRS